MLELWCGVMNGGWVINGVFFDSRLVIEWIVVIFNDLLFDSDGNSFGRCCVSIVLLIFGGLVSMR